MDRDTLLNNFKNFVNKNPYLNDVVSNKEATWQQLYELWFINGEDSNVWDQFKYVDVVEEPKNESNNPLGNFTVTDVFNMVKKVDLNQVQSTINNVEKFINILQTFTGNDGNRQQDQYQQRPLYRRYED